MGFNLCYCMLSLFVWWVCFCVCFGFGYACAWVVFVGNTLLGIGGLV